MKKKTHSSAKYFQFTHNKEAANFNISINKIVIKRAVENKFA